MRRWLNLSLLLLTLLALAGCATSQRSDLLTTTLNAYANAVRWGDMDHAVVYLDPKLRPEQSLSSIDRERYKQLRVSEYDDGNGPVPAGENEVRQVVKISFVNNHTQSERTIVDHQTWHYDKASKHWWLTSGLPDLNQD